MTKTCVVCKKQPIPGDVTRSFHKFPMNNELKQKWMQSIGITEIKKISTVCSDHFEDDSYHKTDGYSKTRRLLSTAVPILNKSSTVLKEITHNIIIPSSVKETSDKSCKMEMNECPSNNSLESSSNTVNILSDSSIQVNTSRCIDEMTTNDKNSMTSKREQSRTKAGSDIPKKKFCFMDGCQPSHVSRADFVSDEAWRRFIKLMMYKNRQIAGARKRSWRRGKQSSNLKELIKSLKWRLNHQNKIKTTCPFLLLLRMRQWREMNRVQRSSLSL